MSTNNSLLVDDSFNISVGRLDGHHRGLATSYLPAVDFTVFAMVIVTMGLLLIVEILRHKLDKIAKGKEFVENVLGAVYHERKSLILALFLNSTIICTLLIILYSFFCIADVLLLVQYRH
jgi:hypothetical protein